MRWAILTAVLALGAARDTAAAEFTSSRAIANRSPATVVATSPVAGASCASGCVWGRFSRYPGCDKRWSWAYHGPYYRRPFDYRTSFDYPWSYAPYNPALYWVTDEASVPVDITPPPSPVPTP